MLSKRFLKIVFISDIYQNKENHITNMHGRLTNLECLNSDSPIAVLPEGLVHISILPPSQPLAHLYLAPVNLPVVFMRYTEYRRLVGVVGWVREVGD